MTSNNQDRSDAPPTGGHRRSSDDAIIAKDLNGVILSWNRAAEWLFGHTAAEVIGQPITVIFPPIGWRKRRAILNQIGRGERVDHYETARRHKDGQIINVSVTVSPIKDGNGKLMGISTILRDLTARNTVTFAFWSYRRNSLTFNA